MAISLCKGLGVREAKRVLSLVILKLESPKSTSKIPTISKIIALICSFKLRKCPKLPAIKPSVA